MVVMLLKRCESFLEGSNIPSGLFTKITHLQMSLSSVQVEQVVKLSDRNLIMLDLSHTANLSVPADFGQSPRFKDLKRLYLRACGLQKLPESLGKLPSLATLDVSSNKLTSLPELLPIKLQDLYASDNRLTVLPSSLQSLANMAMLDVTNNHNLSSFPQRLGANSQIRTVLASCCRLEKGLPSSLFEGDSKLQMLSLRGSRLRQLPANLGSAKLLTGFLSLGDNQLTSLPPSIGHARKLVGLSLNYNKELKTLPRDLVKLIGLSTFDCNNCVSLEPCIGCLPKNLRRLVVTNSARFDVLDAMSEPLTKLEELDASFTATTLRSRLPDNFTDMKSLKALRLNACGGGQRLTALPDDFRTLTNLKEIYLEVR